MRYYCTRKKTEVSIESDTTIHFEDDKVKVFFNPIPEGKKIEYTNEGLPVLVDYIVNDGNINLKIDEALQYLSSTDWYYARKMETGEEAPADVVAKRIEARDFIRSIEDN